MAVTMVSNATGSQNILSNLRVVDFADKIFLLQPEAAPLYVLVSRLNKRPAINTTIEWPENDLNPSWSSVGATASSADTNITVASGEGNYFNKYDLVKIPSTGEIILVTATSTCAVTAIRGYAGSTAACANTADTMLIIGPAFEEGSSSTALVTKSRTATRVYNYLQTFRKSVEVTNTMLNSELYGGDIRAYERKVKGIELMRDLERVWMQQSLTHGARQVELITSFLPIRLQSVGFCLRQTLRRLLEPLLDLVARKFTCFALL
jgi:hypothetical protein